MLRGWWIVSCCLCLTGCVLHTPAKVIRWTFDYNSERHLNAQVEEFDHLPLKPTRIKLMRWGYNVGPYPSGTGTLGLGTGQYLPAYGHGSGDSECEGENCECNEVIAPAPEMAPLAPPQLVPPPAPAAELGQRSSSTTVQPAGHQVLRASVPNQRQRPNAGWMFAPPSGYSAKSRIRG